jgi:hypothetical protein
MLKLIIYGETQKVLECILAWVILEKAQQAEFWTGDFSSLKQMSDSNPHYQEFESFKKKKYIRTL